jgi:hypothetical protein
MKFIKFLKLLNKKIEKYNKHYTTNPFEHPLKHYTIVWVEDSYYNPSDKL